MNKDYFINFTDKQIKVFAKFIAWQTSNEKYRKEVGDKKMIQEFCGDDYVKVLYENDDTLVVLSVDSCIEVVNCVDKKHFANSESVEI